MGTYVSGTARNQNCLHEQRFCNPDQAGPVIGSSRSGRPVCFELFEVNAFHIDKDRGAIAQ
jgi:hypothetical protein